MPRSPLQTVVDRITAVCDMTPQRRAPCSLTCESGWSGKGCRQLWRCTTLRHCTIG